MTSSASSALLTDIGQASQMLAKGRRSEALLIYHDVCEKAGEAAKVQFELGNLCREFGDAHKAVPHYRIATEQAPDNPKYLAMLGVAYLGDGDPEKAREVLEKVLVLDPDIVDAQHALGVYHLNRASYELAVTYLERACELKPSAVNAHKNLTAALAALNRHDDALAHARKAVKLNGSDPGARLVLCETLAEVGEMDEAVKSLEQTIRQHRTFGFAYDLLARIRKFSQDDEPFIRRAEKALEQGMSPGERYCLLYALGKMHDDCGHYEEAFAHYQQANVQQKKPYDIRDDEMSVKNMKKVFTAGAVKALGVSGNPSPQPVFIVGMPRSGTTLMERIIANHPRAAGAGELPEMSRIAGVVFADQSRRGVVARAQAELTPEKIAAHAESYLNVLRQGRNDAERIVDKMPGNYLFIGLIKTLFPNATIINAVRHPLDSCLSCYFQNFSNLRWANEFELIGRMYALYRECMEHWSAVLPAGAILEVRYEQLVEEPERHARRMLEACGLDWDPTVLDFFEQKGVVRTASLAQARQPIYQSSRMRWMNYSKHIAPLAGLLAPYLETERELLRAHGIELPAAAGWLRRILT